VLLTRDVVLVPLAASLLEVVLAHNEDALARMYLTGAPMQSHPLSHIS
jgi:hypothetical protein